MREIKGKKLGDIWRQVPPDYYQKGVKNNLFQRIWHGEKQRKFRRITEGQEFASILDVGCASGFMSNQVKLVFSKSQVVGVDVYPEEKSSQKADLISNQRFLPISGWSSIYFGERKIDDIMITRFPPASALGVV